MDHHFFRCFKWQSTQNLYNIKHSAVCLKAGCKKSRSLTENSTEFTIFYHKYTFQCWKKEKHLKHQATPAHDTLSQSKNHNSVKIWQKLYSSSCQTSWFFTNHLKLHLYTWYIKILISLKGVQKNSGDLSASWSVLAACGSLFWILQPTTFLFWFSPISIVSRCSTQPFTANKLW